MKSWLRLSKLGIAKTYTGNQHVQTRPPSRETPERPRAFAGECRHGVEGDGNRAGEYLPGGRYRVDDTRGQEHARNLVHARYAHVVAVKVQVRAAAREGHPVGKYRQAAHEGVPVVLWYRR